MATYNPNPLNPLNKAWLPGYIDPNKPATSTVPAPSNLTAGLMNPVLTQPSRPGGLLGATIPQSAQPSPTNPVLAQSPVTQPFYADPSQAPTSSVPNDMAYGGMVQTAQPGVYLNYSGSGTGALGPNNTALTQGPGSLPLGGTQPISSTTAAAPVLPNNYNFTDLANYEEAARKQFADTSSADITAARDKLSTTLGDYGTKFFAQQNPSILEDLNSRGLMSSPSAVGNAQAQALKEIALSNEQQLTSFDTAALSAKLQAQQDALDAGMNIRESGLQAANAQKQTQDAQTLAQKLANDQQKSQLTNSLIGVGGSLLGAGLMPGGFLRSAAPAVVAPGVQTAAKLAGGAGGVGGAGALTGTATGQYVPGVGMVGTGSPVLFGAGGSILNTSGTSALGLGSLAAGAAGYYAGTKLAPATQPGDQGAENVGGVIGGVGGSLFGPAGAFLGSAGGVAAGKGANRLVAGIDKSAGNTAGTIARYSNPLTGIPAAYDRAQKAFGFGGSKTADGNAIAATATVLQGQEAQIKGLKDQMDKGEIDPATYDEWVVPMLQKYHQQFVAALGNGSAWATALNPEWQRLQSDGLVKAVNGQWVTNTGKVIWDPKKGYA